MTGRILVRMPVDLHRHLKTRARAQNVSLNQYVVALLSGAARWQAQRGYCETDCLEHCQGACGVDHLCANDPNNSEESR